MPILTNVSCSSHTTQMPWSRRRSSTCGRFRRERLEAGQVWMVCLHDGGDGIDCASLERRLRAGEGAPGLAEGMTRHEGDGDCILVDTGLHFPPRASSSCFGKATHPSSSAPCRAPVRARSLLSPPTPNIPTATAGADDIHIVGKMLWSLSRMLHAKLAGTEATGEYVIFRPYRRTVTCASPGARALKCRSQAPYEWCRG